ncbi:DUF2207 domain-containing protein [Methanosarcina hadiensis]|uniref:DUF2207 domain-containing protein n=1 Tax=Methanosarcina hadiensis TaxID=3078083 RepID=UPI003977D0F3
MLELSNGSFEPVRGSKINYMALKIILSLLFILFLTPQVSAKDYTLEEATTNITIDPGGVAHIEESISYTFDGDYSYVYRVINTSTGESIRNIEGYCSNDSCEFRVETTPEGYRLIGELPEPVPADLTFFISYDYYGAVKVNDDISEFQMQWGKEWERPLGSLKVNITFPVEDESEILYWTHPAVYTQEDKLERNVLNLKTKEIPPSHWYGVKAVFPRVESQNSGFVKVEDAEKLDEILASEKKYQQKESSLESLYRVTSYILVFVLLFPVLVYFRYGREPETGNKEKTDYEEKTGYEDKTSIEEKTDYKNKTSYEERVSCEEKYETETPGMLQKELYSNPKPAVVNAIMEGKMGIPTMDGFTATFMDLANSGYISLRNLESRESGSAHVLDREQEDFMIEFGEEKHSRNKRDLPELEDFEEDILGLLKEIAAGRKISWREFKKGLESKTDFYKFNVSWGKRVQAHTEIDRFFQSAGSTYMNWFSRAILAAAIVFYIAVSGYFPSDDFPRVSGINTLIALIGIWGFLLTKNSGVFTKVFGHWTPEGILCYEYWKDFKEYITDLAALKKYPPESIKAWDSYLAYAASLGVAKQAFQNMSLIVPFEQIKESRFYPISYYYYNQSGNGSENTPSPPYQGRNGELGAGNAGSGFEERDGGTK